MDMYQKRKKRQEMKNNENQKETQNKTNINCSIRKYATHFKNSHKIRVK